MRRQMTFDRSGDWFAFGCIVAIIITEGLHLSAGWVIAVGLVGGWMLNEKRKHEAEKQIAEDDRRHRDGAFPYDRSPWRDER